MHPYDNGSDIVSIPMKTYKSRNCVLEMETEPRFVVQALAAGSASKRATDERNASSIDGENSIRRPLVHPEMAMGISHRGEAAVSKLHMHSENRL